MLLLGGVCCGCCACDEASGVCGLPGRPGWFMPTVLVSTAMVQSVAACCCMLELCGC